MSSTSIDLGGHLTVILERTLRVPNEGVHALPPGLGNFPIFGVTDLKEPPEGWNKAGHVVPMYSAEALWICFRPSKQPVALTIGAGKINAVTGNPIEPRLINDGKDTQSYIVCPPQPWLDGFKLTDGTVGQFVAVKLGSGQTAEKQITGKDEHGGIQLGVHLPKKPLVMPSTPGTFIAAGAAMRTRGAPPTQMGLGRGGKIRQKIYPDPFVKPTEEGRRVGDIWHDEPATKAWLYIVHALEWKALTGQEPPKKVVTYHTYQQHGMPWFDLYDDNLGDVAGSEQLEKLEPADGAPDATFADSGGSPDPETKDLW